jgi:limonene-1,2-epoxide hydrolase
LDTNEKIVRNFLESLGNGTMLESLDKHFADDARWINSGFPAAEGKEACKALAAKFAGPFPSIDVEILALAAAGDHVLVERVDHANPADGSESHHIEVNGSFRLRDGQIVYWYDYFDPRPFLPQA